MDNYDVEDTIKYNGAYNYAGIIDTFGPLGMVSVIGLDRHPDHLVAIKNGLTNGSLVVSRVAVRLTQEDFESYALCRTSLIPLLKELYSLFDDVDVVFDCRVCKENSSNILHSQIMAFLSSFQKLL